MSFGSGRLTELFAFKISGTPCYVLPEFLRRIQTAECDMRRADITLGWADGTMELSMRT